MMQSSPETDASPCFIKDDDHHQVFLHPAPFLQGTTIVSTKKTGAAGTLFGLTVEDFVQLFLEARHVAHWLSAKLPVQRCALVTDCGPDEPARIKVIPLHGLGPQWKPIVHSVEEFHERYPGYVSSRNGPRMSDDELASIQARIRAHIPTLEPSHRFDGDPEDPNLFARIVRGQVQQWRVWEDEDHVAFLTPFPNTPGFTVLIPRRHLSSDVFALSEEDYIRLLRATHVLGGLLCRSLQADSCGLIFEGYEIDYAHVKLVPIFHSGDGRAADILGCTTEFCDIYKGYVSSVDGPKCSSDDLLRIHSLLTK